MRLWYNGKIPCDCKITCRLGDKIGYMIGGYVMGVWWDSTLVK